MRDDRDGGNDGDWFAAQFGSNDDADKGTEADKADKADKAAVADESSGAPGAEKPSDGDAEGSAIATPTAPASGGGFTWGLTPTNAAPPPSGPPTSSVVPEPAPKRPAESVAAPELPAEPPVPPEPASPPTPPASLPSSFAPPLVVPPAVSPVTVVPSTPAGVPPVLPVVPSVLPTAESFFPPAAPPAASAGWPFAPRAQDAVEGDTGVSTGSTAGTDPAAEAGSTAGGEPQPLDAALAGGPSIEAEPPTMALPWEGPATELFAPPAASASVAEPATELLGGFGPGVGDAASGPAAEGSSVDALFGESAFRDYQTGELAAPGVPAKPVQAKKVRAPLPRSQKVLFWAAGCLVALLVLLGLFFLGTKLPRSSGAPVAAVTPTASAKAAPSPTPTVLPVGPLAAGSYKWNQLLGGECLDPFTSPWAEAFTVVDCGSPHPAQMVARGVFAETPPAADNASTPAAGDPASSYPGADALQSQINLLCTAPTVIDFAAAGAYSDIQILGSYPATAKQWADGERSYFCFVTRSSGEPITGSLAVAPAA